jgi:hypothetical protein
LRRHNRQSTKSVGANGVGNGDDCSDNAKIKTKGTMAEAAAQRQRSGSAAAAEAAAQREGGGSGGSGGSLAAVAAAAAWRR